MFDGATSGDNNDTWCDNEKRHPWQDIDHALRELARSRSALDADEARLLCIAARDEIWRQLGKGSFFEYLEEVLGHSPRNGRERVRVARVLDEPPDLADALATGKLHWSAVREITRVATPATVGKWLAAADGKNLREIEQAVAGHAKGDEPDDPPDPDLITQTVSLDLLPANIALLRRAQQKLADERGESPDDNAFVDATCTAYLEGGGSDGSGRAKFQILTVVCPACDRAEHEAARRRYPIDDADRARAECDAQRIRSHREAGR